jgi:tetratricopeptide (TPR) repeat protein
MLAQSAPPSCPADRPVDDLIAEIEKQQSPRKNRNRNPLPEITCIWNWCLDRSRTPTTSSKPAPRAETSGDESKSAGDTSSSTTSSSGSSSSDTSSSKNPTTECDKAMDLALAAAHNVDVGDFNFKEKNYRGAFMRYRDALEEKPEDAAIHVRLGRVLEKLNELPQAIEHYQAAQKLAGPEKWSNEANSALSRLQRTPGS